MAYTAPKWTQMTAPSGTTSVNALTAAGDLFSKAMESAQTGLSNYDKGVEARLKDDSDVNTAALRRRLEGATDLASLNAMQGDISATGLEGYGKRIDADALSQSFDKERGVLRGEAEQQYGEQFQQQLNDATTIEEYTAIRDGMSANPTWYDDASRIQSLGVGMEQAKTLAAQQQSNQLIKESANLDVAGLTAARDAIPKDSLNYGTEYKTYNDQIKALKTKNQDVYAKNANTELHAASLNGVKSLEQARDKLLKQAESDPNLDVSGVRDYFDERRVFALQKTMDKVKSTAKGRRKDELAGNLSALQLATETVFSKGSKAVVFDDVGNFSFAEGVPDALKTEFAQSAKDAGFIGEGADFVTRNDQFFNADSSSLGEDFGSLSSNELDLANQLRQRTNASGLDLSAKATGDLATSTVDIETQYTRNLKRVEDDYKSQELTYAVDPAALKAAQTAKGDAFAHMVSMGFDDNQEWLYELFGDKDAAQDNLRKLINGAKTAGYTDADIIVAIDASTVAAGFLEDKQVNINNFNDFLASTVDLKKKGKDLDKLLAARDIRDAAQLKFDQVRRSDLTAARSGAMTASGVRNSARNAAILDRALGVQ